MSLGAPGRTGRGVRRGQRAALLAVAAVAGAGTMVVELSAVRVLAPWFGTSLVVWTNVISVVLLALALGYLAGARLAASSSPRVRLAWVLLAAAATSAWTPAAAPWVCTRFMPPGVALHQAAGLSAWGSLAASLCLFLPPAALLGCVAPLAVEALQRASGAPAGTAGGLVLCTSTLGSLAGAFATSHYLVPELGLTGAFRCAALALGSAGIAAALLSRSEPGRAGPAAGALALVAAASLAAGGLQTPPPPDGWRVLAAAESPYQAVRVLEDTRVSPPLRFLQVNEVSDSFQSVWQPEPGLLPEGFYYNLFALPAHWHPARQRWRLLVVGLAAGTSWRVIEGALPASVELDAHGIELDPTVVRLARTWLDLPVDDPRRRVQVGDGRAGLRGLPPAAFDQIVVDAYANQIEIPAHLSSVEFFRELRSRLAPGGWCAVNVGSFGPRDPVLVAVAETMAAAFDAPVLAARVPAARNHVVFAREGAALPEPGSERWRSAGGAAGQLLAKLELPGACVWFEPPAEPPLTDERNPIDRLQRQSVEGAAARAEGTP